MISQERNKMNNLLQYIMKVKQCFTEHDNYLLTGIADMGII